MIETIVAVSILVLLLGPLIGMLGYMAWDTITYESRREKERDEELRIESVKKVLMSRMTQAELEQFVGYNRDSLMLSKRELEAVKKAIRGDYDFRTRVGR